MKEQHDLSRLAWKLTGTTPYLWKFSDITHISSNRTMEVPAIPARVPGSVQGALREAGLLPDWNIGLNARQCEWVENRHWIFETHLPDDWLHKGKIHHLSCQGLDHQGWVYLNGVEVGRFENAHLPYDFDLSATLAPSDNLLQIIFDLPPRWLGQFGYTSQMTDWKPRFYYTWDWIPRLVQTGIWDSITLEVGDGVEIQELKILTGAVGDGPVYKGSLHLGGVIQGEEVMTVRVSLDLANGETRSQEISAAQFNLVTEKGNPAIAWDDLEVEKWYPNGSGKQPLYPLTCQLLDGQKRVVDERRCQVGFKQVEWRGCEGAAPEADPWICVVNGEPVFLQGVNWTPIRPFFGDLREADYRQRLETYRDLGCNVLRVWGGGFLEKECFYQLCDELGLLVWQEFPLSSSGVENWPPEDEKSILELSQIARRDVQRRRQHVSLLMWGGGNELLGGLDGSKIGSVKPVDVNHPLIACFAQIVASEDPGRRFVATSPTGPRGSARREDFGKGLHWDVHGPWVADPDLNVWEKYWQDVDALFHSEVGAPGSSPVELIERTAGDLATLPGDESNPLWRRTSWWIEWPLFGKENGRPPASLKEYVEWSQERQASALVIVARSLKSKFPRCGGVIFWMGHDSFPCTANTSLVDYEGNPKPAALALAKVFQS